ncbi:SPJ_0845 family protein [Lacticaseibacillus paracasei]|uniref:SPJ_0845 family protein n=1 Tax=Lacticaseibacillus paracasei TaxID=1597 RepID=UPI0034A3DDB6
MALKINTQTNLNDMFDKFASLPGDKENATGPDPKHHDKLAKKAKEKTEKESKK